MRKPAGFSRTTYEVPRVVAPVLVACTMMVPSARAAGPDRPGAYEDLGLGSPISDLVIAGDCHMLMIGDSITNRNVDSTELDVGKSSMYWGVIRTWSPAVWRGLCIPSNNQYPNIQTTFVTVPYATTVTRILRRDDPESQIFTYGYERIASSPALDVLYDLGDMPSANTVLRHRFMGGDAWPLTDRWFDGPLTADFVYVRTPETIGSIRLRSQRVGGSPATSSVLDPSGPLAVVSLRGPEMPPGTADPEFRILGGDESYNELASMDQFIWLTTCVRRSDVQGFVLDAQAVGGARLADFLEDGLYAEDEHLRGYLAGVGNPNLISIQLGANDLQNFDETWRARLAQLVDRIDRLSAENGATPAFLLVAPYGTRFSITHANALEAARQCESVARSGTPRVSEDRIAYVGLPVLLGDAIDQSLLDDTIHPTRRGADALASLLWDMITRCPADLTGSSNPDDPSFAVPDGSVDADDFFFFLDAFASSDFDVCDVTTQSGPGQPGFGVPDGDCDADDFFFFLDLFVNGC